jgi:hypothetical protein
MDHGTTRKTIMMDHRLESERNDVRVASSLRHKKVYENVNYNVICNGHEGVSMFLKNLKSCVIGVT